MAVEITLGLDTGPAKRLGNILRSPKLIEKKLVSKRGVLQKVGNAMRDSVRENFETGKGSRWAEVSNDILLRRKMQQILSARKAKNTVPPFGRLRANARTFVSDKAEALVKGIKISLNENSKEKGTLIIRDITESPDLYPLGVGELELLESGTIGLRATRGLTFNAGSRVPKKSKALLIPVSNISGGKFARKRGESKSAWFKRAGILKSEKGVTILMRSKASVGRLTIPRRRFIFYNPKALKRINEILTTSLNDDMRSLYVKEKVLTEVTFAGVTKKVAETRRVPRGIQQTTRGVTIIRITGK